MNKIRNTMITLCFIFLTTLTSYAQGLFTPDVLEVTPLLSADKAQPGTTLQIAIVVEIEPEYHINSHTPEEGLIRTELSFDPIPQISFGKLFYPQPAMVKFAFSDEPLSVYEHTIRIYSTVTVADNHAPAEIALSGTLRYQACDDNNCYAPDEKKFSITLPIVATDVQVNATHIDVFEQFPETEAVSDQEENLSLSAEELRAKKIIERGLPHAIIAFFVFGLALNLTPCVYPVIPITVGYFGGKSHQRKGSSFIIALFYVLGIAIVFAILGLVSGLAGKQWGFLFQNPWFVIVISLIMLAMAASMFGVFEIAIPSWLMGSLGKSRQGILGSFIMGLTVGVVIAPCAAGIIIGLVGLVAKLGIVAKGALLFFIMGLGLGLPYLILASFSGLLEKLPQSGMWMIWIKKLFGLVLIGVAIYFLMPHVNAAYNRFGFLLGVLIIFSGLLLGFLDHAPGYTKNFKIAKTIIGILLILYGLFTADKAIKSEPSQIGWIAYNGQSIEQLLVDDKPVIIDFYADWCAPCKEMDSKTFSNDEIIEKAKTFTMVKVDLTSYKEETNTFKNKYKVTGMPTFVFLDEKGDEIEELRTIGYADDKEFLRKMESVFKQ
ncbi:thioredoxin fold domain-containing protein [candidate division KSB1 bacterium]|nr:thioredoxin fold domain-containing protein [candidate division KSB1 bacterium]